MTTKGLSKQTQTSATNMRYTGRGDFIPGVPARDLTAAEWLALDPDLRSQAEKLYTPITEDVNDGLNS